MEQLNNSDNTTISDFIENGTYTMDQISKGFKCSSQGGMLRSKKTNTLVLLAKHYKSVYDDTWQGNILNYTGMGLIGDQSSDYKQNKTLKFSKTNGVAVHLFESYHKGEYIYDGIVELAGDIYEDYEPGFDGVERKVIKFPLRKVSGNERIIDSKIIETFNKDKEKKLEKLNDDEVKNIAKKSGNSKPSKRTSSTTVIDRDPAITEYTKRRAKGICDLCNCEAPFNKKDGNPYLECHHLIMLSQGGPDKYYNTVALCPNCHRRIHILKSSKDFNKLKKRIKKYLEEDNDLESLKEYNILFKIK